MSIIILGIGYFQLLLNQNELLLVGDNRFLKELFIAYPNRTKERGWVIKPIGF